MTKRRAATLALALLALSCGSANVPLLTVTSRGNSCLLAQVSGLLVVDPTYGTAIVANDQPRQLELSDVPVTLAWSAGFTARRLGSEVEVLDPQGNVVATTGRNYQFSGGYVSAGDAFVPPWETAWPEPTKSVIWVSCDLQPMP